MSRSGAFRNSNRVNEMSEEKTELEKAMEKDCIILIAVERIIQVYAQGAESDTKCRGPACAQYDQFNNICRLR